MIDPFKRDDDTLAEGQWLDASSYTQAADEMPAMGSNAPRGGRGPGGGAPTSTAANSGGPSAAPWAPAYDDALNERQDSGANQSQTGYLNFDRFFGANEGVAKERSKQIRDSVKKRAHGAKNKANELWGGYAQGLKGVGMAADVMYDEAGNWRGGAAGPQPTTPPAQPPATEPPPADQPEAPFVFGAGPGDITSEVTRDEDKTFNEGHVDPETGTPIADQDYETWKADRDFRNNTSVDEQGNNVSAPEPVLVDPNNGYDQTPIETTKNLQVGMGDEDESFTPGVAPAETEQEAAWRKANEQALADAAASIEGLGSFADTEGYEAALDGAFDADDELAALSDEYGLMGLTGGSAADAALFSAAGRPDFAKLRSEYGADRGGGLTKDLFELTDKADKEGDLAAERFRNRAGMYEWALNDLDNTQQSRLDEFNRVENERRDKAEKAKGRNQRRKSYREMRGKANDWKNHLREKSDYLDIGGSIWAAADSNGQQGPVQGMMDGMDGGRLSSAWQDTDEDFDIWDAMTEEERYSFSKMGPRQQIDWLEKKRKEKRGG